MAESHISPDTRPLQATATNNRETSRPQTRIQDITSEFSEAASALDTGDLIKDEFFTLFEAVGALEVMDPKMDSGFLAPGDSLEDDYDILRELLPEEMAWHMGHPLSQTLFTSLYIDRLLWPEPKILDEASFNRRLEDPSNNPLLHLVLRAWCLATIKTCDFVNRRIHNETYYEEEDFVPNTYNRPLLSQFVHDDILLVLERALWYLEESSSVLPRDIHRALSSRLEFRLLMLQAVSLAPGQFKEQGSAKWGDCSRLVADIIATHDAGAEVDGSFSAKIQRRLASTVPPRPIVNVDFKTTTVFLVRMCAEGQEAENIFQCQRASSLITFMQILMSRKPQPSIYMRCLYQAVAFEELRAGGKAATREFFFSDLAELVLPAHTLVDPSNAEVEPPQDGRFQIWRKMDDFVDRVCDQFFNVIKAICMNRPRSRRMLCHLVIDWDNLQLDLEDLDTELRQYTHEKPIFADEPDTWELPLSSWAYYYKLRQMEWIVQLGFELRIYNFDEWAGMYCYLQDVTEYRQKHINRIFGYIVHHHKRAAKRDVHKQAAFDHTFAFLLHAAEETAACNSLAECLATLYQALSLLKLLPTPPPRPYGRDFLRHTLRLRPFLSVCLPTLESPSTPFEGIARLASTLPDSPAYASLSPSHRAAMKLLDASDNAARAARKSWEVMTHASADTAGCKGCEAEWRRGIKDAMRAAIMGGIAAARVRKWVLDGAGEGELTIEIDDRVEDEQIKGGMAACWLTPNILVSQKKTK